MARVFAHKPFELGAHTLIGSLPGASPWEATRIVRGELPDLPILPEFPGRGPGADMIGRTMSMVARTAGEFSVETTPTGWRLGSSRSHSLSASVRRGLAWLGEDLDAAELSFNEYDGLFKISMVGPWTLAATVELANGELFLSDPGATRELQAALAETVVSQLQQVAKRLPRAQLVLQLDEPALTGVLGGQIPTASGLNRYSPLGGQEAVGPLAAAVAAAQSAGALTGFHSCARSVPVKLLRNAGAQFISLDLTLWPNKELAREFADTDLGEYLDTGGVLFAGLDALALAETPGSERQLLSPLVGLLARLGIPAGTVPGQLVVTPRCGLAGAEDLDTVRSVCELLARTGRALRDERVDGSSE